MFRMCFNQEHPHCDLLRLYKTKNGAKITQIHITSSQNSHLSACYFTGSSIILKKGFQTPFVSLSLISMCFNEVRSNQYEQEPRNFFRSSNDLLVSLFPQIFVIQACSINSTKSQLQSIDLKTLGIGQVLNLQRNFEMKYKIMQNLYLHSFSGCLYLLIPDLNTYYAQYENRKKTKQFKAGKIVVFCLENFEIIKEITVIAESFHKYLSFCSTIRMQHQLRVKEDTIKIYISDSVGKVFPIV